MLRRPLRPDASRRWQVVVAVLERIVRVRRGVVDLLVLLGVASLSTGCTMVLPSANLMQEYVVNRGGEYFVGKRCFSSLGEVGVSTESLWLNGGEVDISAAPWYAVADQEGIEEFELFTSDQYGVQVLSDNGAKPLTDEVSIYVLASGARWRSIELVLGDLEEGQVSSSAGRMSWDEYMAIPDADFGC